MELVLKQIILKIEKISKYISFYSSRDAYHEIKTVFNM